MDVLTYKLDDFEGPLDLLLHLISKNKLNIYDIPIFELINQYLDYLQKMQSFDMDIASDFLDMSARLIYMKTVYLLPKHEEETDMLKKELTGQLLEYQICKEVAEKLKTMTDGFNTFSRPAEKIEVDKTYSCLHESSEIADAYLMAVGRGKRKLPPPETDFKVIVKRKVVSVASKISSLLSNLRKKSLRWTSLFDKAESRSDMVATFLAVLELVKLRRVKVSGDASDCEVSIVED